MGKFSVLAEYMGAYTKVEQKLLTNIYSPDVMKRTNGEEFELYKDLFEFIKRANELVIHQAETIEIINEKLDKLLVEKTEA